MTNDYKLHILVAEDNELSAQVLEQSLVRQGHRARLANNGRELLALAEQGGFDLLLLDVHMPELDGFQVVQVVRERERTAGGHLPIIALTARSRKEDRERCLAVATGFPAKDADRLLGSDAGDDRAEQRDTGADTMKAISIKQPWANLVTMGEKTIETRTWSTNYRGDILIVSSKNPDIPPAGYALAVATLVECRPMSVHRRAVQPVDRSRRGNARGMPPHVGTG